MKHGKLETNGEIEILFAFSGIAPVVLIFIILQTILVE